MNDPQSAGRRARAGYTPVDPSKFIHIDRPSNASLRGAIFTGFVLWILAGGVLVAFIVSRFDDDGPTWLVAGIIGASLATALGVSNTLRAGRRRREDFVRCGGDPTGMTDMMFGSMRGYRTAEGEWVVPEQGSGDYQGI